MFIRRGEGFCVLHREKRRKDVRINIDAVHLYGENSQDGCDGYEEYRIQCFLYET